MDDTFTFTLDEETEKRLFDLMTDVDVSKTPSFTIKDKYGNEAEYVKAVLCKDCKWNKSSGDWIDCPMSGMYGRKASDNYCSLAERREK